jgi:hypothetical protein
MVTISVDEAQKFAETLSGETKTAMEGFIATAQKMGESMIDMAGGNTELIGKLARFREGVKAAQEVVTDLQKNVGGAVGFMKKMFGEAGTSVGEFAIRGALHVEPFFNLLPKGTEALGKMADAGVMGGNQMSVAYKQTSKIVDGMLSKIPGLGKVISDGFGRFVDAADAGNNLERSVVKLAASSGTLGFVANETNDGFSNLSASAGAFVDNVYNVSQATGTAMSVTMGYAESLGKIPGALDTLIDTYGEHNRKMSMLEASMKVASAFGMEHSEVVNQLDYAYRQLGTTGTKAITFVSNMAQAAQDLQMPMDIVREFTMRTGEAFRYLGDNTKSAIGIMKAMAPALQESGLGPKAIQDLVQGMTNGVAQMDIAHKAFISGATGGAGGLAGGYEIEYLLKSGDLGAVMEKTMTAMQRQFGAPVTTLEDVHRTPALAGQLLKQVSFLKEVAGIAKTDQEAYRILDAMKKGAPGQMAEAMKAPEDVMATTLKRGAALQERGNTALTQIANYQARLVGLQSIAIAQTVRGFAGVESALGVKGRMTSGSLAAANRGAGAIGTAKGVARNWTVGGAMEEVKEDTKKAITGLSGAMEEKFGGIEKALMSGLSPEMQEKLMAATPKTEAAGEEAKGNWWMALGEAAAPAMPKAPGVGPAGPPTPGEVTAAAAAPMRTPVAPPAAGPEEATWEEYYNSMQEELGMGELPLGEAGVPGEEGGLPPFQFEFEPIPVEVNVKFEDEFRDWVRAEAGKVNAEVTKSGVTVGSRD